MAFRHRVDIEASADKRSRSNLVQGAEDFDIDKRRIGAFLNVDDPVIAVAKKSWGNFIEEGPRIFEDLLSVKFQLEGRVMIGEAKPVEAEPDGLEDRVVQKSIEMGPFYILTVDHLNLSHLKARDSCFKAPLMG